MTGIALVVASFLGFVVLGATQSLYGPAIPAILSDFHIGAQAAGFALAAHFVGGSVGVLVYARLRRAASARVLIATSYAVMGAGCFAFAAFPSWSACVAAAGILGLGFGGIDFGLNEIAASDRSPRGTALLNMLHAFFGVGAIAGPWLLSVLGDERYGIVFAGCGALALALALVSLARFPAASATNAPPAQPPAHMPSGRALAIVVGFVVFYVLHVGIEIGVGGWEPTHLIALGYDAPTADQATAAFWFAMTAGRLLVVPLVRHVSPRWLVTGCFVGMAAALVVATIPPLAPAAYIAVGLFIAPMFPTGLPWLLEMAPDIRGAMPSVFAASMLGGVIFPPALGWVIAAVGAQWLPVCLAALSLAGCLVCVALMLAGTNPSPLAGKRSRRQPAE
jgi:MFS transporter, FHS family, glucose/mannose:H+ symporter